RAGDEGLHRSARRSRTDDSRERHECDDPAPLVRARARTPVASAVKADVLADGANSSDAGVRAAAWTCHDRPNGRRAGLVRRQPNARHADSRSEGNPGKDGTSEPDRLRKVCGKELGLFLKSELLLR